MTFTEKTAGALFAALFYAGTAFGGMAGDATEVVEVAPVWSGHPVGFSLFTHRPYQFAAFYDANRRMTVASRRLEEKAWRMVVLPETVDWDSHNSVTMAIDRDGRLHLSGNMHVSCLTYFRTAEPLEIASFERIPAMVGQNEDQVTYPKFLHGPGNELIFTYRDGKSGAGNQVYNVYHPETQTWRRLLDEPLVDGRGRMNAYFDGPKRGPDGFFHLCWVWRDTPDCSTNHDLCYARSKDLVHWESSAGRPFDVPITFETAEVVDPVPSGGGMINGNAKLGFDPHQRPVITYHKFDDAGITQLYHARREEGGWKIHRSGDWDYRWEFSGGGSIHFAIQVEPVRTDKNGRLIQSWRHDKYGAQHWRLDPVTLKPLERVQRTEASLPEALAKVESQFPGMEVRFQGDSGSSGASETRYLLRWEALGHNRDRPREKPWPPPSMLRVYRLPQ